jgi:hypothetical protein
VTGVEVNGPCEGGFRHYRLFADLTVKNTSGRSVEFSTARLFTWSRTQGSRARFANASVLENGGFVAGQQVGPGETERYAVVAEATMPCDLAEAKLFAVVRLTGRDDDFTCSAVIISNGGSVPAGAVGGMGLAALFGITLVGAQRRKRARASAASG